MNFDTGYGDGSFKMAVKKYCLDKECRNGRLANTLKDVSGLFINDKSDL